MADDDENLRGHFPVTEEPKREPTHPGAILEEALEHAGISVATAAEGLGITRQTLHRVIAKTAGVTPDMAVRLGRFFGNGPDLWLAMQQAFDLWHAERRLRRVKVSTVQAAQQAPKTAKRAAKAAARRGE